MYLVDRALRAPYVRHVLLNCRDNTKSNLKLFPGLGEVGVDRLLQNIQKSEQPTSSFAQESLFEMLETANEHALQHQGQLKADKAKQMVQTWTRHRERRIEQLADLAENEAKFISDPYAVLQDLVRSKDSLISTKRFLQARNEPFSRLPNDTQIQLIAKATLDDSYQVCLTEGELIEQLQSELAKTTTTMTTTTLDDDHSSHSQALSRALLDTEPLKLFTKEYDQFYYLAEVAKWESKVARSLAQRAKFRGVVPAYDLSEAELDLLSDKQRDAVHKAMQSRVFLLTGGPGTGKTFVLNKMLRSWQAAGMVVEVCTYTARSAKNLRNVANAKQARTIHRALFAVRGEKEGDESSFQASQVECNVFVVDEATLVDLRLMHHILERLHPSTTIVLIGDENQLPSIGKGSVFRDLLSISSSNSNISNDGAPPVFASTRLDEPRRYKSQLHELANAILRGSPAIPLLRSVKQQSVSNIKEEDVRDVVWIPLDSGGGGKERIHRKVADEVALILAKHKTNNNNNNNNVDNIQVLVKQHAAKWNHDVLRPLFLAAQEEGWDGTAGVTSGGNNKAGFVVGDRVMHLVNDYAHNVANGEMGKVVHMGFTSVLRHEGTKKEQRKLEPFLDVSYPSDDPEEAATGGVKIVQYVGKEQMDELSHAYAMTVHKSQGCEFEVVIIIMHGCYPKWTKEMFYTACTRTKRKLYILAAAEWDLKHAVETREPVRTSHLCRRLRDQLGPEPAT